MSILKKYAIGFVLDEGFRAADVIGLQAVLGALPTNQVHYIAENHHPVRGMAGVTIQPTTTFQSCPKLDVLIIGQQSKDATNNKQLIEFIGRKSAEASRVVAISNGVLLLAKSGVLNSETVTADLSTLQQLKKIGFSTSDQRSVVHSGKFLTSGPSTGAIESAFMILRELRGDTITRLFELTLEYHPQARFAATETSSQPPLSLASQRPLKVAVLAPPALYSPDVIGAIDVLNCLPDTEFYYVWSQPGNAKSLLGPMLFSDTSFDDCPQVDVIIIGAVMPWVSNDPKVAQFLQQQEKAAKAFIMTCAGVFVAGGAGLLEGKHAASNFHMLNLLPSVGAIPASKTVECDGKFFSAGPAIGSYEAALLFVEQAYGADIAAYIEQQLLEYSPNPVMGTGTPELAGKWLTLASHLCVKPLNPIYRWMAYKGWKKNRK